MSEVVYLFVPVNLIVAPGKEKLLSFSVTLPEITPFPWALL
jgi:hypothetical protein